MSGGTAGDGFVKNNRGIDGCFGLTNASPSGTPNESKFGLNRKFLLVATSGLAIWAALLVSQPARAEATLTVADISATLRGSPPAAISEKSSQPGQQATADDAVSALTAFAQQIGVRTAAPASPAAPAGRQVDDQTLSALKDFTQRLGNAQPESIKTLPKLAEAETLMDFLAGKGSSSAPTKTGPVAGGKHSTAPVEASYVGAKTCLTCHASQTAAFEKTLMGKIGKTQKGKFDCENCHGPGSAHVKAGGGRGVGGIISFRPNDPSRTAEENNGICLSCHEKGERTLWHGSTHETRGLMCTNCHTVMKNVSRKAQLKTEHQPDTCFQCHKDIQAKMARSEHMPVREGKVDCTNCHNPHGSYSESLIKTATVNEVCFQCHAEKRGPFLWEHPPVTENCLNCHDPHGSMNANMLTEPRPRLCQRCHNVATRHPANPRNPTAIQSMNSGCANCHSQFHGSNSPGGQRFLR